MRFLHTWPFSNPNIEVVIFCLHGWCTLGVFLMPAFTCLGHECQGLLSPCHGMHGLDLGLYSHLKEFWGNGVRNHVNSTRKIPSTGHSEEGQTCNATSRWTASPTHHQHYSVPLCTKDKCLTTRPPKAIPYNVWRTHCSVMLSTSAFLACHLC